MNYTADGRTTQTVLNTTPNSGTYTYNGNTLVVTIAGRPSAPLTVTEITSSRHVTVSNTEDATSRYVTTDTFTR